MTPANANERGTVTATNLGHSAGQTVLSGFYVLGPDIDAATPDNTNGAASVAVYIADCGPGLVVQNNILYGGHGGPGGRGSTGGSGYGRQDNVALDGGGGLDSVTTGGPCPPGLNRAGGIRGVNSQCQAVTADPGGNAICPVFDFSTQPYPSQQQQYASPSGVNGAGGWDWSYDDLSGPGCGHVTESGWPSSIRTHHGQDGSDGSDGTAGGGGNGGTNGYGSIAGGLWIHAPVGPSSGGAGSNGAAGGGGGAGGGTAFYPSGGCADHEEGATGGGGGAGGCGGGGGAPGGTGGASLVIFVYFTSPASGAQLPIIRQNRIRRGPAGAGGTGGFGGPGGQGGNGGFGGDSTNWSASVGGKGGDGGNGGPGGGGGGSSGGPSFGILGFNIQTAAWGSLNLWDYANTVNTGGVAGVGGGAAAVGSVGQDGVDGPFTNLLYLRPCGAGGSCPGSLTCDINNVCIPN